MGFLSDALKSAYKFAEKNAPKMQEYLYQQEEKKMNRESEIMDYKSEYSNLNNDDLADKYRNESGLKKKAAAAAIQERKGSIALCKENYSSLDNQTLLVELKHLKRNESFYDGQGYHKLTSEEVYVRENVINSILKSRGIL